MPYVIWTKTIFYNRDALMKWLEAVRYAEFLEVVIETKVNSPYGPPAKGKKVGT